MTRTEVVALARGWIGTPYVTGQALKGAGCDCVGLVRGVLAEVTGRELIAAPPFRADWAAAPGHPLLAAARLHLVALPLDDAAPGDVLALRLGPRRVTHAGILAAPGRLIHAVEGVGVAEVSLGAWRARPVAAFALPGVSDLATT